eukprot:TRINITY_DN34317_c0_g1_i1.p1 TRINITY_DN34317_c0_g1~~TRINITY_DN34317_c0_g1_i1.p1  ORF type:complete len:159 (-),score=24.16 TRINITY_DN34317_c0_g1_i1:141-581(-)
MAPAGAASTQSHGDSQYHKLDAAAGQCEEEHTHWKSKQYFRKLPACITLDAIGDISMLIPPPFGELSDVVYAPLYAFFIYKMFASWKLALLGFLKELLPYADFIPLCTILWVLETCFSESRACKTLGVVHPREHPYEGDAKGRIFA